MTGAAPAIDPGVDSWVDGWCAGWAYNDHGFDPPSPGHGATADVCDLVIYSNSTYDPLVPDLTRDEYDALADDSSLSDFIDGMGVPGAGPCVERPVYGDTTDTCENIIAWAAITGGGEDPPPEDPPAVVGLDGLVSVAIVAALALAVIAVALAAIAGAVVFRRG